MIQKQAEIWWTVSPAANIGIYTGRNLLVVDIDVKNGKLGEQTFQDLVRAGHDFPATYEQRTPTGGRHLFYRVSKAVKGGTELLGPGVDIKSRGGYVVGAGSHVDAGAYTGNDVPIADAPQWLIDRCEGPRAKRSTANRTSKKRQAGDAPEDRRAQDAAKEEALRPYNKQCNARAEKYLRDAPVATEGAGGDDVTYKVACRVRGLGVNKEDALEVMLPWNERCVPPWAPDELQKKIDNAYQYAQNEFGSEVPEIALEQKNREYAYISSGNHILNETVDERGQPTVEHLALSAFHNKHAAEKIQIGKRPEKVTHAWLEWDGRRSYDALAFRPSQSREFSVPNPNGTPRKFYNLYRGFRIEPAASLDALGDVARAGFDLWLEHMRENIAGGNKENFQWIVAWLAHMVQRPEEKLRIALALRGPKGVGKNAAIEPIVYLLGPHASVQSNPRFLRDFNGVLENALLIVLDEAVWSGDKTLEGRLKDLITGSRHMIEKKGLEAYSVDNLTRVIILTNEPWAVSASRDERRYAVFNVGSGRQQDSEFFGRMIAGLKAGGYALLLRFLLDFDTTCVNLEVAPATDALAEQKELSMSLAEQYVDALLAEGALPGRPFGMAPENAEDGSYVITVSGLRTLPADLLEWGQKLRYRPEKLREAAHELKKLLPAALPTTFDVPPKQKGVTQHIRIGPLGRARQEWAAYMRGVDHNRGESGPNRGHG